MAEKTKKDYYKKLKDSEWNYEDSYQDTDVFEDNGHEYSGPVRKKSESGIDFKDYDEEGPKKPLEYLEARDIIGNIIAFHKIENCDVRFDSDPELESDTFILTCNDFVFVDDNTEKDYRDKCNDVVKLIRKEFKKETGKTLTAKEVTHSFVTQMYGNHYGDLPLPGADVQTGVHQKNRSYVTYTCAYEYSV